MWPAESSSVDGGQPSKSKPSEAATEQPADKEAKNKKEPSKAAEQPIKDVWANGDDAAKPNAAKVPTAQQPDDIWGAVNDDTVNAAPKSSKKDKDKEATAATKPGAEAAAARPNEEPVDDIWANAEDDVVAPKTKSAAKPEKEPIEDIWATADDKPSGAKPEEAKPKQSATKTALPKDKAADGKKTASKKPAASDERVKPSAEEPVDDVWANTADDQVVKPKAKSGGDNVQPGQETVEDIWANADDGKPKAKLATKKPTADNETKPEAIDDIWGTTEEPPRSATSKPKAAEAAIDDIWGAADDDLLPKTVAKKGAVPQDAGRAPVATAKPTAEVDEKPKVKKLVKKKPTEDGDAKPKKTIAKKKVEEPTAEPEQPVDDIWGNTDDVLPRRRSSTKEVPAPVEDIWANTATDAASPPPSAKEVAQPAAAPTAVAPAPAAVVEAAVPENKYPWRKQVAKPVPAVVDPVPAAAEPVARIEPAAAPTTVQPAAAESVADDEGDFWGAQSKDELPAAPRKQPVVADEVHLRDTVHNTETLNISIPYTGLYIYI